MALNPLSCRWTYNMVSQPLPVLPPSLVSCLSLTPCLSLPIVYSWDCRCKIKCCFKWPSTAPPPFTFVRLPPQHLAVFVLIPLTQWYQVLKVIDMCYLIFDLSLSLLIPFWLHACHTLEENTTKSVDSTPEKAVVKERILEKIDLSKGISPYINRFRYSCLPR